MKLSIKTLNPIKAVKAMKLFGLFFFSLVAVTSLLMAQSDTPPVEEVPVAPGTAIETPTFETPTSVNSDGTTTTLKEFPVTTQAVPSVPEEAPVAAQSELPPELPSLDLITSPLNIYNAGVTSYNNSNYQMAIEKFEELIALGDDAPNTTEAINLLSRAYTRQGYHLEENLKNLPGAEKHYRLAIEKFSEISPPHDQITKQLFSFAHNRLGVLIYTTQFDAENKATERALKEAFSNFNTAININKENSSAHNNKGIAYSAQGDSRPAIASFTKAIEYNENNAIAYLNRGTDNFFVDNLDAALGDFKEVIRYQTLSDMISDPAEAESSLNYAKEMLGFTHLALGNSLYHQSLHESAINNYQEALTVITELGTRAGELTKFQTNIHLYLGTIYAQKREFSRAEREIQLALTLNPDYADAYNNLGIVYYDTGELEKAIDSYSKALLRKPELAEAYLNRGNAYNKLGQPEAAQADYERASSLGLNVFTYFKQVSQRSKRSKRFQNSRTSSQLTQVHAYSKQPLRMAKSDSTKKVFIF